MWINRMIDGLIESAGASRAVVEHSRMSAAVRYACILTAAASLAVTGCQDPTAGDRVVLGPLMTKFPDQREQGPTDKDSPKEFTEISTGLKYRILRKSDGRKPTVADTVYVHYRGWLDDGTEFDSSYKTGQPNDFALMNVVVGWTQGLQFVGEGGMIELEVPGKLGYGPQGKPPVIPPDATLHFIIELVKIKD